LEGAYLHWAWLNEADLSKADLEEANLRWAKYTDGTTWPTGFDPVDAGAIKT
jgi:uncharacterized protein YjbI with pentapeptide repeats